MKEYLIAEIQSRQGIYLKIILSLTHHLKQVQNQQSNQIVSHTQSTDPESLKGNIQVYCQTGCYFAQISSQNLNQDVIWNKKYLQLLQQAFSNSKDKHINLIDNKLSIVVDIAKGIRVIILSVELIKKQISITEALVDQFIDSQNYFQSYTSKLKDSIKQNKERNKKYQAKTLMMCEQSRYQIKKIKQQAVGLINQLKLIIKKGQANNQINTNKNTQIKQEEFSNIKNTQERQKQRQKLKFTKSKQDDQSQNSEDNEQSQIEGYYYYEQIQSKDRVSGIIKKKKSELDRRSADQDIIDLFLNGGNFNQLCQKYKQNPS